jgi:hypothetical protein
MNTRVGPAPVALRIATTPNVSEMVGGMPQSTSRIEVYVLLSALPTELQERVKLAVQAVVAGR